MSILHEENKSIKEQKELKNKQKINTIMKYANPIGKVLLYTAAALSIVAILYILDVVITFLIHCHWKPIDWIKVIKVIKFISFVIILVVVVGSSVGGFLYLWSNYIDEYVNIDIFKPFRWLWKGLCTIFSIIEQLYKNNCPAINWKD